MAFFCFEKFFDETAISRPAASNLQICGCLPAVLGVEGKRMLVVGPQPSK